MFRKLILTAVLALAALTTAADTADASPPALLPHHHFEVLVARDGGWQSRGVYRTHVRAELLAVRLRHQGYKVEIRQF